MVARQLHLVRHGEVHNPERVLYGRLPGYRLSELGQQMAEAAAADLAGRGIRDLGPVRLAAAAYAGSAAPIAALQLPVQLEPRIIEPANHFEGKRMRDALKQPANWPALVNPMRPSWGEAYRSIAARVIAAMNDAWETAPLMDDGSEGDIVMVSHQLPIWITHSFLAGDRLWHDPRQRRCALSSITSFSRFGGTFVETGYTEPAASISANAVDLGAV